MLVRLLAAAAVFLSASAALADGCWTQKADFPYTAAREPLSVSAPPFGYVGNTTFSRAFYRYKPALDVWQVRADIPGGFDFQAPAFAYQGKPHAVVVTKLYRYEPATNVWSYLGTTPTKNMRGAFAVMAGTRAYLGGGFYNRAAFWHYDVISGAWTRLRDLPADLADCTDCSGFALGGKPYVTGTNTGFWRYDPATDRWAQRAYVDAVYGEAFAIAGTGYVLNTRGNIYAYDPSANSWRLATTLPGAPVCSPAVLAINDSAYVAFGTAFTSNTCTLDPSNAVWQWTPACSE